MSCAGAMEMKTHQDARRVRRFLIGLLVVSVTLGISSAAASAAPGDWPQQGLGPAHTGFQTSETQLTLANISRVRLAWAKPIPDAFGGASPVVVGGTVFIASGYSVIAADARTGATKWNVDPGGSFFYDATPAVANGIVYIGGSNVGANNNTVYALNASTGAQVWSRQGQSLSRTVVVRDGIVFAVQSLTSQLDNGSDLYAYDANTGAIRWHVILKGYAHGVPAVARGKVFTASSGTTGGPPSSAYAFDEFTGKLIWRTPAAVHFPAGISVGNGLALLAGNGGYSAFNADTGTFVWSSPRANNPDAAASIVNGVAYIHVFEYSTQNAQIEAISMTTGKKLWGKAMPCSFPCSGADNSSQPAIANSIVYLASPDGLVAYRASDGRLLRLFAPPVALPQAADSSPAISHGSIYVGSGSGLAAYGLNSSP